MLFKHPHTEKKIVKLFLLVCFIILMALAYFSEGTYESGDSIQHYLISKYSFKHPELFLHNWGKPFFTLVSAPFSQFGFIGIVLFNVLCATLTAWTCYLIAIHLHLRNAFLIPIFSLFTPIYFISIISGLTELFFSLLLVSSIYLVCKKRYYWAAFLISFLPFVRSEGFLIIGIFALFLLFHKQWKTLPILGVGTILYSIAGYLFLYHDFFWIKNSNPYQPFNDIYGHGSFFHFISKNEFIFGTTQVVLIVLGIVSFFFSKLETRNSKPKTKQQSSFKNPILLIIGSFVIYFTAHSYFWWKGIYGSLGLIRVMAAVTPLLSFLALSGFNFLDSLLKNQKIKYALVIVVLASTIWMPFKQDKFPRPLSNQDSVVKQASEWYLLSEFKNSKTFFLYPYWVYFTDKDPFDNAQASMHWGINESNINQTVKQGEIFIWDTHFSPNEGHLSLEILKSNPNFKLLRSFIENKKSEDKNAFEVYIFQRL